MSHLSILSATVAHRGERGQKGYEPPSQMTEAERQYVLSGADPFRLNTKLVVDATFDNWPPAKVAADPSVHGRPEWKATVNGEPVEIDTAPVDDPSTPGHDESASGTRASAFNFGFSERVALQQEGDWEIWCELDGEVAGPLKFRVKE